MGKGFSYTIEDFNEGHRIDKFLAEQLEGYTRSTLQRAIKSNAILVNGNQVKPNYKLQSGDIISGCLMVEEEKKQITILPEAIPLNIAYEDKDLAIINKNSGMVIHPAHDHPSGTLVNALLYHYEGNLSTCAGLERQGIVHRIDKDTSGLIIVAKNNPVHEKLATMLYEYEITRKYHVIVSGNFTEEEGIIDAPIGRHPTNRTQMTVVDDNGREAITSYKVLRQFQGFAYAEVTLHTGRTHQIRVHMKHIGHPVLGDPVYGPKKQSYSKTGQLLHAKFLSFNHPITNGLIEVDCPLPEYFQRVIDNLPKI